MSRATNDLAAVRMMLGPGIMYLVNTVAVAAVSIGFMLAISPRLTLLLAAAAAAGVVLGVVLRRAHPPPLRGDPGALRRRISARVQENLSGRAGGARVRARGARGRGLPRAEPRVPGAQPGADPHLGRVPPDARVPLRAGGAARALPRRPRGDRRRASRSASSWPSPSTSAMLNWPVFALGWVINLFQRGMASFRRIVEILEIEPAIHEPAPRAGDRAATRRRPATIEFRDLTFTYPGAARPALRDVSLRVPAGHTVALVGRTGSGKSTLLSLLPRMFDPPPGTVFLDGVDVRALDLAAARPHRARAPGDVPVLGDGRREHRLRRRARDAARRSSGSRASPTSTTTCAGFPERLRRPWSASAGSRSRAASTSAPRSRARCCATRRCCCSTTASRASTRTPRRRSSTGLRREMRRRTTLLVSHRVSTVRDADLIVVLEDGAIVERGTHDELLRSTAATPRSTASSSSKRSSRPREPHDEDALGRAYDHRLMRRLLGYLRPYRGDVVAGGDRRARRRAGRSSPGRWLTKEAIDHGIRHRDLGLPRPGRDRSTWPCWWSGSGSATCRPRSCSASASTSCCDLRMSLFRHLQRLPVSFFDRNPIGRLMTRVTNDVDVLNELFTAGVVAIVRRPVRAGRDRDRDDRSSTPSCWR